jgi:hypothetical protein
MPKVSARLTAAERALLDGTAARLGVSRAEVIRRCVQAMPALAAAQGMSEAGLFKREAARPAQEGR